MILIGLTGSIGMGKSTTARMFADEGIPVWDADAAVARLYGTGGAAVPEIARLAPDCVVDNAVDRAALRAAVTADASLIGRLEQVVHPLVGQDRARFLAEARAGGADMVLCDIPLLFETGGDGAMDVVVVATTDAGTQRARVLARPGMTEQTFQTILAKQTPDADKRSRADFLVDTSHGMEAARAQVRAILSSLKNRAEAGNA